jgi:hypothetical protein
MHENYAPKTILKIAIEYNELISDETPKAPLMERFKFLNKIKHQIWREMKFKN